MLSIACLFLACLQSSTNPRQEPEIATIFFASIPPVADIYADGNFVGKTNIEEIEITAGEHDMSFRKDTLGFDTSLVFTPGKNASRMVRLQ
jgi:hypothetical protein